ncbi:MAG: ketohydroxyglutarate aldolase [Rhodothalassiaceae bacterium]|nr:MAG: ketohydroxyglutarate aldolase [Rhodothalassiaceae bacterium]
MTAIDPAGPLAAGLARQRLLPVLTIADAGVVPALAEILRAHALTTVEVTLRTPAALDAAAAFVAEGDFTVALGTLRSAADLARAAEIGADFAVTPGTPPALLAAAADSPVPVVPAAATPSEMMALADAGFRVVKFFPAAALGRGILEAVRGPLPELAFIANGGIGVAEAGEWLAADNVIATGMTALAPPDLLARRAFGEIARRVHAAVQALP